MTKFVTFGETMTQYNATYIGPYKEEGDYILDCAGAESNVAVDLQKLGISGIETVWVSRVGDDEAGDFVLRELDGRTSVQAKKYAGQKTGVSYLNHHSNDKHIKTYYRKGSAACQLTFEDVEPHLKDADVLHVTGITPALSQTCHDTILQALRYAKSNDIPVSFDLNYRDQLWTPEQARPVFEEMLSYSTIFKLGHDEAETIWAKDWTPEKYAKHFQQMNRGVVLITRGSNGAIVFDGDNWLEHPGYQVEMVDPVGAGDAFVAGFIGGIFQEGAFKEFVQKNASLRADILKKSLELANVCGALTCTRRGDTAAMPTMKEAEEFVNTVAKLKT